MKRIRIGIAGLLTALAVATGGPGGDTAVQAASGVSYCFKHDNGVPASTGTGSRTILMGWTSGTWKPLAYGWTGASGCSSFTISGSYRDLYTKVVYNATVGFHFWWGQTPLMANPGNAAPFLGTGIVRQQY